MTSSFRAMSKKLVALGVLLLWASHAPAQPATSGVYRDPLNGFSLRPPKGGVRMAQDEDATYLARWVNRDKSGDVVWTLTISRMILHQEKPTLAEYAQTLRDAMLTQGLRGSTVDPPQTTTVSGLPAIELTGLLKIRAKIGIADVQAKEADIHFRQLWVRVRPAEKILPPPVDPNRPTHKPAAFLVLKMGAPQAKERKMEGEWKILRRGLNVVDPVEFLTRQKENTERSAAFLKTHLTPQKVASVLPVTPQWFLLRQGKISIGWLCVEGGTAREDEESGYQIRTWAMVHRREQKEQLIRQRLYVGRKFRTEKWRIHKQIGLDDRAPMFVEDGVRQHQFVMVDINEAGRRKIVKKDLPVSFANFYKPKDLAVRDFYLPKTIGMILPRLLDLTRKATYTFAEYSSLKNDFNMRTFTVIGPETITLDGKEVESIKVTDQSSYEADPAQYWLTREGRILRARVLDGTVTETTTRKKVLKLWPNAETYIKGMKAAERVVRD